MKHKLFKIAIIAVVFSISTIIAFGDDDVPKNPDDKFDQSNQDELSQHDDHDHE